MNEILNTIHMFYSINTSRLRNAGYLQLMRFIEKLLIQSGLEPLIPLHHALKVENDELEERVKSALKHPDTIKIHDSDTNRDICYTNLVKIIDANRYHRNRKIAQASNLLFAVVENHGKNVPKLGLTEETAVLSSFISEIRNTSELSEAVSTVGVLEWINNLEFYNTTCENLLQKRSTTSLPKRNSKNIRGAIDGLFQEMKNHLIGHITLGTEGDYTSLKNEINQLIKESNEKWS